MMIAGTAYTAPKLSGYEHGRTRSLADTLADCRRLMARTGITRLANLTGMDRLGLPVWTAIRPNSRSLATAQGKGCTADAAKVSALMEAIESWHGERIELPVIVRAFKDFPDHAAMDPRGQATHRNEDALINRPIEWILAWDVAAGRPLYVPFDMISSNFVEHPERRPLFLRTTNGLASGNHLLEAIVYGLLELIERDALTLHSLKTEAVRRRLRVDCATIPDPGLRKLLSVFDASGVNVAIEDMTSDVAVPAFTCTLSENPRATSFRPVPRASGHGAHLDPVTALTRAVHEAVQSRATLISGSRDDMFARDYDAAIMANRQTEQDTGDIPDMAFNAQASASAASFEADLQILLDRLAGVGIGSVAVVDLTRADIGIPVVKLVVPGLEPVRTAHYRPGARARRVLAEAGA